MPITAQQILDLKNDLIALKKEVALAQINFDNAIAQNTLWHVDKSKLPNLNGAKKYVLDNTLLPYIQYDEDGNFMVAEFDYAGRRVGTKIFETPENEGPPYFVYFETKFLQTNGEYYVADLIFGSFLNTTILNINAKYALLNTAKSNLQSFLDNN